MGLDSQILKAQRSVELPVPSVRDLLSLGALCERGGRGAEAAVAYDRAAELDPQNTLVRGHRLRLWRRRPDLLPKSPAELNRELFLERYPPGGKMSVDLTLVRHLARRRIRAWCRHWTSRRSAFRRPQEHLPRSDYLNDMQWAELDELFGLLPPEIQAAMRLMDELEVA